MEAKAGQGRFQALRYWWSQGFKECLSILGLHGGEGLTDQAGPAGTMSLPCRGRDTAHLGGGVAYLDRDVAHLSIQTF